MNEPAKTLAFVAAGILAMAAAFFVDYGADKPVSESLINKTLSPDIDVSQPKRLQVIKFDRATAEVRKFEVAEVDGVWSLPSKQDYPADATEQMASAVTSMMGRKILRIAGETGDTHEKYGVVDPLSPKLNSKSAGVGTRVIISDADDNTLIDMIIGKTVKGSPGQRYVRSKQQNIVYVVEIDPSSLSTDFENWIEDDLLKLDTFALSRVFINDYSADLGIAMSEGRLVPQITRERRGEITLSRDKEADPWQIASIKKFESGAGMVDDAVGAEEEVNQDVVGKLVSGLDDLLIVDVARKPAGLSADLKAGEAFLSNQEAVSDLVEKGFLPGRLESGADMLSSEGEVVCTLNNGVEYILRFGQLRVQTDSAGGEEADEAAAEEAAPAGDGVKESTEGEAADGKDAEADVEGADDAADGAKEKADPAKEGENLRRYLFVMARFNESAVPKPELKELPELPADDGEAAAGGDEDAAFAAATEEGADAADDDDAEDAATDDAAAEEGDEAKDDDERDAAADGEGAEEKPDPKAIMAERKKIEEENQRLMDEYQSSLAAGEKTVGDLNQRFGDWYFVISNDVYKQIHLGRDQVIKKKEAPKEEGAEGAAADDGTAGLPQLPGAAAIEEATKGEGAEPAGNDAAPAGDAAAAAVEGEQEAAATEVPATTEPAAPDESGAVPPQ